MGLFPCGIDFPEVGVFPSLVCHAMRKYLTRTEFDGPPPVFDVEHLDSDETLDVE